jgi:hypothetical protein
MALRSLRFLGAGQSRIATKLPESIHTSNVSLDLATASAPFQSFGRNNDQSSPADLSNQMFEPCFSIKPAALRTI